MSESFYTIVPHKAYLLTWTDKKKKKNQTKQGMLLEQSPPHSVSLIQGKSPLGLQKIRQQRSNVKYLSSAILHTLFVACDHSIVWVYLASKSLQAEPVPGPPTSQFPSQCRLSF